MVLFGGYSISLRYLHALLVATAHEQNQWAGILTEFPSLHRSRMGVASRSIPSHSRLGMASRGSPVVSEKPQLTHVTVTCQRCSQPIKLNRSLNPKALLEVVRQVEQQRAEIRHILVNEEETHSEEASLLSAPHSSRDGQPEEGEREDLQTSIREIRQATESLKVLSTNGDIDHPLCASCPDAVMQYYVDELRACEEAHRRYETLVQAMETELESGQQLSELDQELAQLQEEEARLEQELMDLHSQMAQAASAVAAEQDREACIEEEEQRYWVEFNAHQADMLELRDQQTGVELQLQNSRDQLSRMKRTSVLNTAFHIWHNGHFATVNGLRLGKLPNVPVEWPEINAAWGQTALLLNTLASVCGLVFQRYKLIPYGSQSFIQDLDGKKKIFPLYTGSRLFSDAKFDTAMVAFLDCLSQFKAHIENTSSGRFMLPYRIDKDRIGDGQEYYSIRVQFNSEERWTKALKFVLTNLRWGMTWVSANLLSDNSE